MRGDIHILVVVPVYNHGTSLAGVVRELLGHAPHVLVVDDGSTDVELWGELPFVAYTEDAPQGLYLERHKDNQGKGAALLTAARFASRHGFTHVVTLDADGQHSPADVSLFVEKIHEDPMRLWIGERDLGGPNVPFSSRFGRAFSNFWVRLETGFPLADTQSGFRAYPTVLLESLTFTERRYSFEVEVLVRAAWAGFCIGELRISVYYPPGGERISHFRALYDNVLISLLHTRLVIRSTLPIPGRRIAEDGNGQVSLLRPVASLKLLIGLRRTPRSLGLSAALGFVLGALPLIGIHVLLTLWLASRFRLNRPTALAAGQLCIPPFVPALCVEIGHYVRHGRFLTEVSWQTLGHEATQRLLEWLVGSLSFAPLGALILGSLVWGGAWLVHCSIVPLKERS